MKFLVWIVLFSIVEFNHFDILRAIGKGAFGKVDVFVYIED